MTSQTSAASAAQCERQRGHIAAPDGGDGTREIAPAMPGDGDLQRELRRLLGFESGIDERALDGGVVAALVEKRDHFRPRGARAGREAQLALVVLAGLVGRLGRGVEVGHEFIRVRQRLHLMREPEQVGAGLAVVGQQAFGIGDGDGFSSLESCERRMRSLGLLNCTAARMRPRRLVS